MGPVYFVIMLSILWFTIWVTVGEAFYDDIWYTNDEDIIDYKSFESQRIVRNNFTGNLRSFAKPFGSLRDGDELTLDEVRSKLRMLKVHDLTDSPKDFEPGGGQVLPLIEGAKYCTMGRHTRVNCNYCTCVAGQLYMCTGIVCPATTDKSRYAACEEGRIRKIDSCNHCICHNGHEICSTRNCRLRYRQHWDYGRPDLQYYNIARTGCIEGEFIVPEDRCNICICHKGETICTHKNCSEKSLIVEYIDGKSKNNMINEKITFCEPFTFFSPDHNRFCRNCFCLHNGLALCLLNMCKYSKDVPHQHSADEISDACEPGERGYPTKCVTCLCSEQGKWECTREDLEFCQERDCDEKDEFHMGFNRYCAGCKCSIKEWYCAIRDQPCEDYSNATCPMGTFIHNPQQHCSICLCGGNEGNNLCFTEAKCVRQVDSRARK